MAAGSGLWSDFTRTIQLRSIRNRPAIRSHRAREPHKVPLSPRSSFLPSIATLPFTIQQSRGTAMPARPESNHARNEIVLWAVSNLHLDAIERSTSGGLMNRSPGTPAALADSVRIAN
jgi:hypothetical protein